MHISTKYFGEIECAEEDILHFRDGLVGFEEEQQFLLLPFEGSDGSLLCMQSVKTPGLAFIAMNPFSLHPGYAPLLQSEELHRLAVQQSQDLCYYVLCAVKRPVAESTVNLKCPIVINDETRQAMQVILEQKEYEMRHLLADFHWTKGASSIC